MKIFMNSMYDLFRLRKHFMKKICGATHNYIKCNYMYVFDI